MGITAGEAANPRKSVPRAINGTFWRIMIFYVISIFLVGLICSGDFLAALYDATESKILRSPFVVAFSVAKIPYAADFMNFVAFIAVFSAGNSSIYAASRTMMSLCQNGQGPAFLGTVVTWGIFDGVPIAAVLTVTFIGTSCFLGTFFANIGGATLFDWLVNLTGLTVIVTWIFVCLSHIRFRSAYILQGYKLEDLPYKSLVGVTGDYIGVTVMALVIILSGTADALFLGTEIEGLEFLSSYCGLIPYPLLYFGYRLFVKGGLVPLDQIDLKTGHLDLHDVEEVKLPKSSLSKVLNFIA